MPHFLKIKTVLWINLSDCRDCRIHKQMGLIMGSSSDCFTGYDLLFKSNIFQIELWAVTDQMFPISCYGKKKKCYKQSQRENIISKTETLK